MDQQHPIPQEISTYQFRLVGDMTLKQFFQVASGIVIALIIYSSPIIGIIKWPLVIIFGLAGVALAFLPIEERPLERWVIAFIRSVYSPTLFFWKKTENPPLYFQEGGLATIVQPTSIPLAAVPFSTPAIPAATVTEPAYPPALEGAPPAPEDKKLEIPDEKKFKVKEPELSPEEPGLTIFPTLEEAEKSFLKKISSIFSFTASMPTAYEPQGSATTVSEVPGEHGIKIKPHEAIRVTARPEHSKKFEGEVESVTIVPVTPTFGAPRPKLAEGLVQFSKDAAPPYPPSLPNVIVGQVIDRDGKIIEGAILEIKDSQGHAVRALRSNKLGHFMTVTPLPNGHYQIEIDKAGFSFEPFSFEAKGELMPPIGIKAKEGIPAEGGLYAQAA
jgi:hypothetical protein